MRQPQRAELRVGELLIELGDVRLLGQGCLRAASHNARLLTAATADLPAHLGVRRWERLADLPHYSEDLDTDSPPSVVAELRAAIAEADALVLSTPEYNGSVPAALKNALDWASRPRGASALAGKRVLVLGASASPRAAQWAREDLVRILTVTGADVHPETFGLASSYEHLAADGLADAEQAYALRRLVSEFTGALVPA